MVKDKATPFLKIFITLCLVLLASCRTLCQNPQYDNLSFGIPGKADTIIDRPGYALGYSEYHEQAAWVIYIMTREEATLGIGQVQKLLRPMVRSAERRSTPFAAAHGMPIRIPAVPIIVARDADRKAVIVP